MRRELADQLLRPSPSLHVNKSTTVVLKLEETRAGDPVIRVMCRPTVGGVKPRRDGSSTLRTDGSPGGGATQGAPPSSRHRDAPCEGGEKERLGRTTKQAAPPNPRRRDRRGANVIVVRGSILSTPLSSEKVTADMARWLREDLIAPTAKMWNWAERTLHDFGAGVSKIKFTLKLDPKDPYVRLTAKTPSGKFDRTIRLDAQRAALNAEDWGSPVIDAAFELVTQSLPPETTFPLPPFTLQSLARKMTS